MSFAEKLPLFQKHLEWVDKFMKKGISKYSFAYNQNAEKVVEHKSTGKKKGGKSKQKKTPTDQLKIKEKVIKIMTEAQSKVMPVFELFPRGNEDAVTKLIVRASFLTKEEMGEYGAANRAFLEETG